MTIAARDDPADPAAQIEASGTRYVMVRPGGTVLWRLWGKSGRKLVLLHGASGAWTHWIRNIPALSRHWRVIAPDMPGFGMSDLLPATHTADALADLVAAGIEEVLPGTEAFDLAGFSFGGIIAGLVAARLGARVRTLVPAWSWRPGAAPFGDARARAGATGHDGGGATAVHRDNLRILMIAEPDQVDALAVILQIENLRRARFRSGHIPESDALARVLPDIRTRIVTIWGERDAFIGGDLEARRRVFAPFQSAADFRVIANAGHWLPYEAPDEVNAILNAL